MHFIVIPRLTYRGDSGGLKVGQFSEQIKEKKKNTKSMHRSFQHGNVKRRTASMYNGEKEQNKMKIVLSLAPGPVVLKHSAATLTYWIGVLLHTQFRTRAVTVLQ